MAWLAATPDPLHEVATLRESIWRAPLLTVALVFTAGVVLDRLAEIPLGFSLLLGGIALGAFALMALIGNERLALAYLLVVGVGFGSAYHAVRQRFYPTDDIGYFVSELPQPARLRGRLIEQPHYRPAGPAEPLRTLARQNTATTLFRVNRLDQHPVSGLVRLVVTGTEPLRLGLHPGDEIEVRGRLARPATRHNPGEFNFADYWHQRGVHAVLTVPEGEGSVRLLKRAWIWSPGAWLGVARQSAQEKLDRALPDESTAALAQALLLGEGAAMSSDDWQRYIRTGVIHVIAISGQHLVIVGFFLWTLARLLGVRQRRAALGVALVLFGYALLTGARPPALRSAVAAGLLCMGLVVRRPVLPANLLGLGWLAVGLWQPADLFEQGCQLSFLSVVILCWAVPWLLPPRQDPLEQLLDRTASWPVWLGRQLWRGILNSYTICFIVWLAVTPLAAFHTGLIAPAALVLGPPLALLAALALLLGLLGLLLPDALAWLPGLLLHLALSACQTLVTWAEHWSLHVQVGQLPLWWVVGLYLVLLALLTHRWVRIRWRWLAPAGLTWFCVALLLGAAPRTANELRVTFLAVGHGGAIVLELPDGRTVLYDAGSLRGPEVGSRVIAPFLWSRRIYRLDDVILSHADLDHFNALLELSDRFAIGRILTSETFLDKPIEAVTLVRQRLGHLRWETLAAGDRLTAAGVTLAVLHPPRHFRAGNENARSIVLEVRHGPNTILLTGDLEGEGLARLLRLPPRKLDVLMAPHHGSSRLDGKSLVRWGSPELVIACQAAPRNNKAEAMYALDAVEYWTTHSRGAITVRSCGNTLNVEAYHDGRTWHKK